MGSVSPTSRIVKDEKIPPTSTNRSDAARTFERHPRGWKGVWLTWSLACVASVHHIVMMLFLNDQIDLPLEHIDDLFTPNFKNTTIEANRKNTTTATKEAIALQPTQAAIARIKRRIPVYHVEAGDRLLRSKRKKGPLDTEFARALGHVRAIHRAYHDTHQKDVSDLLSIHSDVDITGVALILEKSDNDRNQEKDVVVSDEFLQGWKQFVDDSTPVDWSVLSLSTFFDDPNENSTYRSTTDENTIDENDKYKIMQSLFPIHASNIYRDGTGDSWISWSPMYLGGIRAYLITRNGMKSILDRTDYDSTTAYNNVEVKDLFDQYVGIPDINIIDTSIMPPGLAEGLLFCSVKGSIYASTFPRAVQASGHPKIADIDHKQLRSTSQRMVEGKSDVLINSDHRFNGYSVMVITFMRVTSLDRIKQDSEWIRADASTLARVHGSESVHWKIRVVVTEKSLLDPVRQYLYDDISGLAGQYRIEFDFLVQEPIFNKWNWVSQFIPVMPNYNKVIIKDLDQRIAGMPWKMFMDRANDTMVAAPLREALHDSLIQNRLIDNGGGPLVQARAWMGGLWARNWLKGLFKKKKEDKRSANLSSLWQLTQFSNSRSLELPFLEQYFVALDGKFAEWFFSQTLTPHYLNQTIDRGIDLMWCAAAKSFAPNRTSCALVTVTSVHEDTRSIGWQENRDYVQDWIKLTTSLRKEFPQWYNYANYVLCQYCPDETKLGTIESKCNISNGEDVVDDNGPIRCELNEF